METDETELSAGEEVVKAAGELHATVSTAVDAAKATASDHDEVQGWITTILKAIFAALK